MGCGSDLTQNIQFGAARASRLGDQVAAPERRIHTRLHHGPVSRRVIALASTGQHGMAATGQVRLAVVRRLGPDTTNTARIPYWR